MKTRDYVPIQRHPHYHRHERRNTQGLVGQRNAAAHLRRRGHRVPWSNSAGSRLCVFPWPRHRHRYRQRSAISLLHRGVLNERKTDYLQGQVAFALGGPVKPSRDSLLRIWLRGIRNERPSGHIVSLETMYWPTLPLEALQRVLSRDLS